MSKLYLDDYEKYHELNKDINVEEVSKSFDISILSSFDLWRFNNFCDKIQAIKNKDENEN